MMRRRVPASVPSPRLRAVVACAVVVSFGAGCGLHAGLEYTDTGDTAGTLSVDLLDPSSGPTAGGNEVSLTGMGFVGDVVVAFGRAEVAPTVVDVNHLVVVAPEAGMEVTVDVTVRSDLGEVVLPAAYTYTDGEVPADGVGGLAQFTFLVTACPECFGLTADDQVSIVATAGFHAPSASSWFGWFPDPGTCAVDPVADTPTSPFVDVGQWVYLSSGSVSLGLQRVDDGTKVIYEAGNLDSAEFLKSAQYTLSVADGGELGPFEIANALQTPQTIDTFEPSELLNTTARTAFAKVASRARGLTLQWSPYGGTGLFVVQVDGYDARTGLYDGSILCVAWDDGTMTVPGSLLSTWASGELLAVSANRYQVGSAEIPANGATLESAASLGLLGTATLTQ